MSCVSGVQMNMGEGTVPFTMGSKVHATIIVIRMGGVHSSRVVRSYQTLYVAAILAGQGLDARRNHHQPAKATASMVERARNHQTPAWNLVACKFIWQYSTLWKKLRLMCMCRQVTLHAKAVKIVTASLIVPQYLGLMIFAKNINLS
jgi:hypothetical protein